MLNFLELAKIWILKVLNKTRSHHSQSYELWTCILKGISRYKLLDDVVSLVKHIDVLDSQIKEHVRVMTSNMVDLEIRGK